MCLFVCLVFAVVCVCVPVCWPMFAVVCLPCVCAWVRGCCSLAFDVRLCGSMLFAVVCLLAWCWLFFVVRCCVCVCVAGCCVMLFVCVLCGV